MSELYTMKLYETLEEDDYRYIRESPRQANLNILCRKIWNNRVNSSIFLHGKCNMEYVSRTRKVMNQNILRILYFNHKNVLHKIQKKKNTP